VISAIVVDIGGPGAQMNLAGAALVHCCRVMSDWPINKFSRGQIVTPHAPPEKFLEKSTRDDEPKPPIRHPLRFHLFPSVPTLDPVSVDLDSDKSGHQM
jgi:hypothetical protein